MMIDGDLLVSMLAFGETCNLTRAARAVGIHLGVAVIDLVPRGIDAEALVTTPLCVAVPAKHPVARARTVALADLRGARWILAPEGQLHRAFVTRAIARTGDPPASII